MTTLALDPGEKRIGVAISDSQGLSARPLTVIEHESREKDAARVQELAQRFGVTRVVVGLPLNMDGTPSPGARRARRFAGFLRHRVQAEVVVWDERLTSWEADQQMIASGLSAERRREVRDAVAAAVILQDYLDTHRSVSS